MLAACPWAAALDPSLDVDQYAHTAWKVRDGFSRGGIFSIAQTPDGYLWLGTEFGLLRFDGVKAVPWQPPRGEQLPNDFISQLLVTGDGRLWIGTRKGLASWKDNELTQYPQIADQRVSALLEDHEGTVWVGEESISGHGRLFAIQNGSLHREDNGSAFGKGVLGLFEDNKGNLWVASQTGLSRWKSGAPEFYPMQDELIGGMADGDNGALLVTTRSGLKQLVDGNMSLYPLPGSIPPFPAYAMLHDRDGGLWIGTLNRGIVHVHRGRADSFSQSDGLSGDISEAIFQDREGSIWVATWEGLDRFRDFAVATFSKKQGLSDPVVSSVLADRQGGVWIGTYGGLDRWNSGQITNYGKLDGHAPRNLFQDSRGRIWVSTVNEFGYLEKNRLVPLPGIAAADVHGITEDTKGNLWITNPEALFRLSPRSELERIPWSRFGHQDYAWTLAADPLMGGVWLGFLNGSITHFQDGQIIASYPTADGQGVGLVNRFHFDLDGTVWAATDAGLSRLKNGRIATLTSNSGLPCYVVHWVVEDDDHSLWLYMPCGLIRIARSELDAWGADVDKGTGSRRTIQATVFDFSDGVKPLHNPGYYIPQVTKSSDGKLWFARWDGASVVDPRHIPVNNLAPPVHIEQIVADGKTYDATTYSNATLRLPGHIRELEIDYTALSLVAPEKMLFRYRLEGFDREWHDVGNRRQAFYNSLPPGSYSFRVAACNNSGVWNELGTSLDFSVARAYYQTTLFRVVCGAALLAVLWGLYKLRMQQLERQFQVRMEGAVHERTRIARELHDTLLQSLHGLMFEVQAARNMFNKRPQEALQALDGAIMGTEQAITESQDAIEDLRSPATSEEDLAQLIKATGEDLAASRSGADSPTFGLTVEGRQRVLAPNIRDEVYSIVREVLRNAFRHSHAHRIEAEILYGEDQLRLRVRDDGKGMDPQVLAKGSRPGHWGLTGVRERAHQMGARLDFWSEMGAGTEVQLAVSATVAYRKKSGHSQFRLFQRTGTHEHRS